MVQTPDAATFLWWPPMGFLRYSLVKQSQLTNGQLGGTCPTLRSQGGGKRWSS